MNMIDGAFVEIFESEFIDQFQRKILQHALDGRSRTEIARLESTTRQDLEIEFEKIRESYMIYSGEPNEQ